MIGLASSHPCQKVGAPRPGWFVSFCTRSPPPFTFHDEAPPDSGTLNSVDVGGFGGLLDSQCR